MRFSENYIFKDSINELTYFFFMFTARKTPETVSDSFLIWLPKWNAGPNSQMYSGPVVSFLRRKLEIIF